MLDFIVNPSAGGKNGKKMMKVLHQLTKRLDERQIDYAIHIGKELKSSREKTKELIKNGATDIIAVGGDGTLHEVINGFSDFERVNLGIIPCGTGNDFARQFGGKDAQAHLFAGSNHTLHIHHALFLEPAVTLDGEKLPFLNSLHSFARVGCVVAKSLKPNKTL